MAALDYINCERKPAFMVGVNKNIIKLNNCFEAKIQSSYLFL